MIATASPRSAGAVRSLGAHEVVDYTATPLTEAGIEPVDVLVNLVRTSDSELAALTELVRDNGIVVSTATPGNGDPARGVRASSVYVHASRARAGCVPRPGRARTLIRRRR
ncbi:MULTISPECIES: zinc-binding dehydrogenase [Amycolatopsis]|uniref:Zinc-binding dehydrogenase n=1 Tax=Amycolatopsis dongchuanensis TaxID=1070866 RepID=A0ABP8VDN4_9PSEU